MRDKSIIWITGGGIAFWLLVGYGPSRAFVVDAFRVVFNNIVSFF
jgi:hypothetical protein